MYVFSVMIVSNVTFTSRSCIGEERLAPISVFSLKPEMRSLCVQTIIIPIWLRKTKQQIILDF